jgi:hypothetical protein
MSPFVAGFSDELTKLAWNVDTLGRKIWEAKNVGASRGGRYTRSFIKHQKALDQLQKNKAWELARIPEEKASIEATFDPLIFKRREALRVTHEKLRELGRPVREPGVDEMSRYTWIKRENDPAFDLMMRLRERKVA